MLESLEQGPFQVVIQAHRVQVEALAWQLGYGILLEMQRVPVWCHFSIPMHQQVLQELHNPIEVLQKLTMSI